MFLTKKINILLVDDSPSKLFALETVLAELDQNLVTVNSGKQALRLLLQQDFAVILLDVNMPELDGFETAQLIRQRKNSEYTPIIFVTGISTNETHVSRGYSLGAVDYLFTPVVPEVLRAKVAVFIELFRKTEQIKESQKQLAEAQHIAHLGRWHWEIERNIMHWSDEVCRTFGIQSGQFEGTYEAFVERVHPEDQQLVREAVARASQDGKPYQLDFRIVTPEKQIRSVYARCEIILDDSGKPTRMTGITLDITERKQAEAALRASEEKFRSVTETALAAIVTAERDGTIIYCNHSAERIFGYTKGEILGRALPSLIPRKFRHLDELKKLDLAEMTSLLGKTIVLRGRKKNGKQFPIELSLASWKSLEQTFFTAIMRDITERKAAEEQIQQYTEDLEKAQQTSLQIMKKLEGEIRERNAAEKNILEISGREQRRMGQELHDGLGQTLTGISFMSKALARRLGDKSNGEAKDAAKISTLVNEAICKTRDLARGFYPVELESNGLISALQELAAREESLFKINCCFQAQEELIGPTDLDKATQVYRIAQEAIENAIKHGKAGNIVVKLVNEGDQVNLIIQDDGIGFPKSLPKRRGMGLQIMKYRAGMIQGVFNIKRQRGGGTIVTCTFPDTKN
jgi:PAS domain S-box-containing protein